MKCIVTAGPTYEPLDDVRRLTNFSTGRLGSELANFLAERGHKVTLLIGEMATHRGKCKAQTVITFSTTADLRKKLKALSSKSVDAIFHAAAVSDFAFGKIQSRSARGKWLEIRSKKISTRAGNFLAELIPTPKIITELRGWFPAAKIIGWKFEVEGKRADAIHAAKLRLADSRTDACVANGAAYGKGFGLVTRGGNEHLADAPALYEALEKFIGKP
ncbi:MAG: phosphopantothenoylcysteine decarboxylase [Limisphaerales bacterium]